MVIFIVVSSSRQADYQINLYIKIKRNYFVTKSHYLIYALCFIGFKLFKKNFLK